MEPHVFRSSESTSAGITICIVKQKPFWKNELFKDACIYGILFRMPSCSHYSPKTLFHKLLHPFHPYFFSRLFHGLYPYPAIKTILFWAQMFLNHYSLAGLRPGANLFFDPGVPRPEWDGLVLPKGSWCVFLCVGCFMLQLTPYKRFENGVTNLHYVQCVPPTPVLPHFHQSKTSSSSSELCCVLCFSTIRHNKGGKSHVERGWSRKTKVYCLEVWHMTRTVFAPVMASLKIIEVCYIESTRWTSIITHGRGRQ